MRAGAPNARRVPTTILRAWAPPRAHLASRDLSARLANLSAAMQVRAPQKILADARTHTSHTLFCSALARSGNHSTGQGGCRPCDRGYRCPGASVQIECGSGRRDAPELGFSSCTQCEAGKFNRDEGATGCVDCPRGFYCGDGATEPVPCPEGTFSNGMNLAAQTECSACPAGY